ncbi:MAG TPA: hypothetical protein VGW38_23275, partial [Chloroflexota bacterium]|nr:hypothetical protein [Chloroflexota bacterium]
IWHFDDKVAQYYLLRAVNVPIPMTWVLWSRRRTAEFLDAAQYPLVLKLAGGIVSQNVRLVHDAREARYYADQLFGPGMYRLPAPTSGVRRAGRRLEAALRVLLSKPPSARVQLQRDYVLLQEFLPGNTFDTRVTVIGNRAFAFRRHNRPGDFRASGSGRIDWDPTQIAEDAVRLAFRAARTLQTQSLAVDVLRRNSEPVVGEISYYYEGWAVAACPGHWQLHDDPESGRITWVDDPMRPEDAIWVDFLARLGERINGTKPSQ